MRCKQVSDTHTGKGQSSRGFSEQRKKGGRKAEGRGSAPAMGGCSPILTWARACVSAGGCACGSDRSRHRGRPRGAMQAPGLSRVGSIARRPAHSRKTSRLWGCRTKSRRSQFESSRRRGFRAVRGVVQLFDRAAPNILARAEPGVPDEVYTGRSSNQAEDARIFSRRIARRAPPALLPLEPGPPLPLLVAPGPLSRRERARRRAPPGGGVPQLRGKGVAAGPLAPVLPVRRGQWWW